MDPVQKAIWFVESHSHESISLETIANSCKVSSYHLTRAFAAFAGLSLMRYVRARRLTEAARKLAQGAPDILALALNAGYGSHEAFTRAFRDQFGLTPEQVRSQGHVKDLNLVEAMTMSTATVTELDSPRFESRPQIQFAGLAERHNCQSPTGIPDQWQRFAPHIGRIPGQAGYVAFGVCYNFDPDGNFDYMCAVEITGNPDLPAGFTTLDVPAQRYAVFLHRGHIAGIRSTMTAIWNQGIPKAGLKPLNAPSFERYGPEFNPQTGLGGLEVWVPIEA
jgi:AraC family transcriptional regulator